jgi:hypothetical protein
MAGKPGLAEIRPGYGARLPVGEVHRLARRPHRQRSMHKAHRAQARTADVTISGRTTAKLLSVHRHHTITYSGIPVSIYNVGVMDKS